MTTLKESLKVFMIDRQDNCISSSKEYEVALSKISDFLSSLNPEFQSAVHELEVMYDNLINIAEDLCYKQGLLDAISLLSTKFYFE